MRSRRVRQDEVARRRHGAFPVDVPAGFGERSGCRSLTLRRQYRRAGNGPQRSSPGREAAWRLAADVDIRIHSLGAMAQALGRGHPLDTLLEIAAEEARDAINAATVSVSRLEPGTGNLRTILNVGDLGPQELRWPQDETYTLRPDSNLGLVIGELRTWTATIDDPDSAPFERKLLRVLGKRSSLGAPILVDGQLWGEFYATRHHHQTPFSDTDSAYVQALIAILAGAVSRWLREESLELLAFHDPLTGLLNRRALDRQAMLAFDVPSGSSRSVTAVVMDINRLKHINDTLGHGAGDRLIQSVARAALKAFSRLPGSLVARVGGDEFIVLVSGYESRLVIAAADQLCREEYGFGPEVGVSAGAVTAVLTTGSRLTPADLFAAADRAQYEAKRGNLSHTTLAADLT
jgi:diguanylate cyclase (GGDEF)-like protein